MTLKAPTPYFLEMLTHQAAYPVNKASIEKVGADWIKPGNLVSNGAYTLAEWVPNDHIKMIKNPKFHDAANVKIDVVNFIPTEDRSSAMKRFEAGELDSNDDMPTEQLSDLKAKFGDQIRIATVSRHLLLRHQDRQGAVGQREAAQRRLDGHRPRLPGRESLAELDDSRLFDGASRHRGLSGSPSPVCRQVADRSRGRGREDPRRARLRPDKPLKMEIRYNTSENHKNTAVAIQEQLKPLGIEVTLLNTDTKTHYGASGAEG